MEEVTTIELEPDTVFIVECDSVRGSTWVECPTAESAYLARWQLSKDTHVRNRVRIINVIDDEVVFST